LELKGSRFVNTYNAGY